jgi:hypothetical protein
VNFAREFWNRVGKIRNAMDQSLPFHAAQVSSMDTALAEIQDELCEPWFNNSAFPALSRPPSTLE